MNSGSQSQRNKHFDNFNKEFEELRVKISHPKAIAILQNINKSNKKLFVEAAILHYYADVRSGKITSNSITFDDVQDIEEASPSPVAGTGLNTDSITQILSSLVGGGLQLGALQQVVVPEVIQEENEPINTRPGVLCDKGEDEEVPF